MSEPHTPPPPPQDSGNGGSGTGGTGSGSGDSGNRTLMLVLSYLGPFALIPFLVEKDDAEVQWHAKHGLVLLAAEILLSIGLQLIVMVLSAVTGGLGCIFSIFLPFIWLAIVVVHIICIAKALKGERFLIPGVSQYADKF